MIKLRVGDTVRYTQNPPNLDGYTAISLFVLYRPTATLNDGYIWSLWNYFDWGSSFTIKVVGTNILFAVHGMAGGYKMRITTNNPVVPLTLLRICCRWSAAGTFSIMINGVECPIIVFSGYDGAVTSLGPTVSEAPTLGLINIPVVGEQCAAGDFGELAIWSRDIGSTEAAQVSSEEVTLALPKAAISYPTNLTFYAPLCRSLYPASAYPDPSISDIIRPANSLLFGLANSPDADAPHPWTVYPTGTAYGAFFCPVTFTGASCSGGVVPQVANPPGGVEFHGLGPHEDRVFIELDLD